MPLILSVTPVAADDIPDLIEKYFQNEDLIRFSALFSVVGQTTQNPICTAYIYAKIKTITDFSVIALTLYRDMDLLTLPHPQVTVKMPQKNREINLNNQLFPCFIAVI